MTLGESPGEPVLRAVGLDLSHGAASLLARDGKTVRGEPEQMGEILGCSWCHVGGAPL